MNIGDSSGKMKRHSDMKPELNDLKYLKADAQTKAPMN